MEISLSGDKEEVIIIMPPTLDSQHTPFSMMHDATFGVIYEHDTTGMILGSHTYKDVVYLKFRTPRTCFSNIKYSHYCVIVYVGHFCPPNFGPISVQSLLYTPISLIFTTKTLLRMPLRVSPSVALEITRAVRKLGGGEVTQVAKIACGCAHEIILLRDLLCQSEARLWVPVWLPVSQGDGHLTSADHL